MTPNEYQQLAARTECRQFMSLLRMRNIRNIQQPDFPPQSNDNPELVPTRLNHAALGMAGEVGEFAGAVERWIYYGKDRDDANIVEELGDLLWYIAEACNALSVGMEDVMLRNIRKLQVRFPEKYTDEAAAEENRDRAAERGALLQEARDQYDKNAPGNDYEPEPEGYLDGLCNLAMAWTDATTDKRKEAQLKLKAIAGRIGISDMRVEECTTWEDVTKLIISTRDPMQIYNNRGIAIGMKGTAGSCCGPLGEADGIVGEPGEGPVMVGTSSLSQIDESIGKRFTECVVPEDAPTPTHTLVTNPAHVNHELPAKKPEVVVVSPMMEELVNKLSATINRTRNMVADIISNYERIAGNISHHGQIAVANALSALTDLRKVFESLNA